MTMQTQGMARGDPASYVQYGQNLARQGQYDKAITIFEEALKQNDADPLSIMDSRSAIYCKMGKFDQALRDARHMIKSDKQDERGYLRAAKALLLDQKAEKALEVYTYALKTLSEKHPRRSILENLQHKVESKIASKYADPFAYFPLEIAEMILKDLNFRQTVAIMRVSKRWSQFLERYRFVWMRLDLTGARKKVPKSAIRKYINLSRAKLTHVVLNNVFHGDVAKILEWLSYCRNLVHLEIAVRCDGDEIYRLFHQSKSLKTLITSADVPVTRACIFKLMKELPCLETIEIRKSMENPEYVGAPAKIPKIRKIVYGMEWVGRSPLATNLLQPHLGIFGGYRADPSGKTNTEQLIAETAPGLEELGLHYHPCPQRPTLSLYLETTCFPRLRKLELTHFMLHSPWMFPRTLEHLAIRSCVRFDRAALAYLPCQLSHLKILILENLVWLEGPFLASLLPDTDSALETLELKHCFQILPTILAEQARNLRSLHTCVLEGMYGLDDRDMGDIIRNMPSLRVLSIPDTSVTGVLIKKVVSLREDVNDTRQGSSTEADTPRIEVLNLKGCSEVSSDAVEYGRQKGIRILI